MATDRDRPAVAMTGVVQPRGRNGLELRCLVCSLMYTPKAT